MKNLKEFVKNSAKTVYVRLSSKGIAEKFLRDAEMQGFTFPDGTKPTEHRPDGFFALHHDMTMNYIGAIGRTAWQCSSGKIVKLDYEKFSAE